MSPELDARLRSLVNFPSPPAVAAQIIELAQQPNADLAGVARVISLDPAIAAKVLRIANSPLFAPRRRSENLRQALIVLGLNATLTIALSFSLLQSLRGSKPNGVNHPLYWRRSLIAATAARALGEVAGVPALEELFLAGLLQDLGMLALDRAVPDLYHDTHELQRAHRELAAHERRRLGLDHAEAGAWLLTEWKLPARLTEAVAHSHSTELRRALDPAEAFTRCVALSGSIADLCLQPAEPRQFQAIADAIERSLGVDRDAVGRVIEILSHSIPETETLYEQSLLPNPQGLLDAARAALIARDLQDLPAVDPSLPPGGLPPDAPYEPTGEHPVLLDPLTGVFRREFLDRYLAQEFEQARRSQHPLSVALVDLDGFRAINAHYGDAAGDEVLKIAAGVLKTSVRRLDVIARLGGQNFILVLPATDSATTQGIGERVRTGLTAAKPQVRDEAISVSASVGCATFSPELQNFDSVDALVTAAGQALYTAKLQGRDRVVPYESVATAPLVHFL
jgi:diguanylate cyclase (GGDEF)-like protein